MEGVVPTEAQETLLRNTFGLSPDDSVPLLFPLCGGMTNASYRFTMNGTDYFFREPGRDSGAFISRPQEALVYKTISDPTITDDVLVLEPDTGRKIARFIPGARTCDPTNWDDVARCMALLRRFHEKALHVDHEYDILWLLDVYTKMMPETSMFRNYSQVCQRCRDISPVLKKISVNHVLCHCDASPTNFLFYGDTSSPQLRLIDWEFSGSWDPCGDIACFATASGYKDEELQRLIHLYLQDSVPSPLFTLRVYGHMALMSMVWSNWAEYLAGDGFDTAGYGPAQFQNADYYSKRFWDLLPRELEAAP